MTPSTLALVVVDNLGVAQRTGIPVDKLLIASTHAHSAPASNT